MPNLEQFESLTYNANIGIFKWLVEGRNVILYLGPQHTRVHTTNYDHGVLTLENDVNYDPLILKHLSCFWKKC